MKTEYEEDIEQLRMRHLKFKESLYNWVSQIGIWNEGCMCWKCKREVQKRINASFDEYVMNDPGYNPETDHELTHKS